MTTCHHADEQLIQVYDQSGWLIHLRDSTGMTGPICHITPDAKPTMPATLCPHEVMQLEGESLDDTIRRHLLTTESAEVKQE